MNDNRKISEIYKETITAINKLEPDMDPREGKQIIEIIHKNRKQLGLTCNISLLEYTGIKELKIDIMDNIEMAVRDIPLPSLYELKQLIKEEPSFLEQFNF